MALSSVGIGSGLNVDEMVTKLVALEKKPLEQLQKKASSINAQISAYGQLQSQIANFQTQVDKLTAANTWQGVKLSSSNAAVVSGTASSKAASGTFDVSVQQLASGQTLGSGVVAAGMSLGTGTLSFALGEWGDGGLTTNVVDGKPATFSVEITEAEDTLDKIAAKINQAGGGVTATVLRDHTGERLSLQSTDTGANAGFSVAASQATGSGLEQLAYNGSDAPEGSAGMRRTQAAQDTVATINGLEMRSRTNTFEEVATGVNLSVSQKMADSDAPVRITLAGDTETGKNALKNLVESYNALSSALATMTAYNAETKTAGTLQGDSTALNLQSALRRALSGAGAPGSGFGTLSDIGLQFQKDGTLKIDDAKLDKALKDPQAMTQFFAANPEGTAQDGWAVRIKDFTTGLLASDGMLSTKNESLKQALTRNGKDQNRVNDRAESYQKRLLAQYTRLDTTMAKLTALDSYINQQVTSWNQQKN